jgi:hypothetical protein
MLGWFAAPVPVAMLGADVVAGSMSPAEPEPSPKKALGATLGAGAPADPVPAALPTVLWMVTVIP